MNAYLKPTHTDALPGNLTLNQFLQTVMVGVSGLPGPLVRPKWQQAPPKQPDIDTNWLAFGVSVSTPDANSYLGTNADGSNVSQRHEGLELSCSFYGPDAFSIAGLVRDGFQVPQNRTALFQAKMGFVEVSRALHMPELINERFINRVEMSVILRREIIRSYPIPILIGANGTIHTVLGNEEYLLDWVAQS